VASMETAAHYRQEAAKMRALANRTDNLHFRSQYLELAAEYEKLAERAEAQQPPERSGG
jgi:hypothetical protein